MNTCATCKWGRFEMTKHKVPRINAKKPGECEWPLIRIGPVPRCVWGIPFTVTKSTIWADFEDCPTWEAR